MRVSQENSIIKKFLIVFITIIMISNFIMPNYVHASAGAELVSGLFHLLAYLGDAGIKIMQYMMIGTDDIGTEANPEIKYSPGMIFANQVSMLDINFIDPMPNDITIESGQLGRNKESGEFLKNYVTKEDFGDTPIETYTQFTKSIPEEVVKNYALDPSKSLMVNSLSGAGGSGMANEYLKSHIEHLMHNEEWRRVYFWFKGEKLYKLEFVDNLGTNNEYNLYECDLRSLGLSSDSLAKEKEKVTPANALQNNIATWYVALRTIALVGLLSVLVYLGIRIILSSSSSQDKAKYKNMLKDWVVAICILFMLHYAMAFMLQMSKTLNNVIKNDIEVTTESGTSDKLMNTVRKGVGTSYKQADSDGTAGYVIMYFALVILTGVFTVQYLKRVIYMAFLTMIAPMIALTYPLDKVKDGKAQAFSFWLREYLFNCLIQPVHLILYTVLIKNAIDLATGNILYAVVTLGFLVPAEKFIKAMFGMKSQSPVGTLGAAAGGALVMNMLGKIKKKEPKGEGTNAGGTNSPKGVRTATNNSPANATAPAVVMPTATETPTTVPSGSAGQTGGVGLRRGNSGSSAGTSSRNSITPSVGRGLRNAGKNIGIRGVDAIKSASLGILKSAPGVALGATIGLAATVASGGEKAGTFIAGGIAAGSALSSNALGGLGKFSKDIYDDYQKGKFGVEEYNNKKFDSKFFKSDEYKKIAEDSSIISKYGEDRIKNLTQSFLDNGITDADKIRTALQKGISGDEYKEYSDAGITDVKEMSKAKQWTIAHGDGTRKSVSASYYANLKKIAKIAKGKNKEEFVSFAQNIRLDGETIQKDDAETIYKNMVDLL